MKKTLLALLTMSSALAAGAQCSASFTNAAAPQNNNLLRWYFLNTSSYGTVSGSQYLIYNINFGDGSGASLYSYNYHNYATPGTYTVGLRITKRDSLTQTVVCTDSTTQVITVGYTPCAASVAYSINSVNCHLYTFTATNPANTTGMNYSWSFGDGTSAGNLTSTSHTYTTGGTYTVTLLASNGSCTDTNRQTVTVCATAPANLISGYVFSDSMPRNLKVWLITFDSSSNLLSAVDSVTIASTGGAYYSFANKAAGTYRTKAAVVNGPTSGTGFVPTYHDSSLYWSSATLVNHAGATTTGINIFMQHGTVTTGPGFVGGNVSLGANKGASAGVPGITVYLMNSAGKMVAYSNTDASGNFAINNLPVGTYSVYPENMNYATTAFANIVVSATTSTYTNINFNQDNAKMSIKPRSTTGVAGVQTAQIVVFPNPAHGSVTLSWQDADMKNGAVMITNLVGQTVYHESVIAGISGAKTLNLTALNAGIYFIHLHSAAGDVTSKLVLQ